MLDFPLNNVAQDGHWICYLTCKPNLVSVLLEAPKSNQTLLIELYVLLQRKSLLSFVCPKNGVFVDCDNSDCLTCSEACKLETFNSYYHLYRILTIRLHVHQCVNFPKVFYYALEIQNHLDFICLFWVRVLIVAWAYIATY